MGNKTNIEMYEQALRNGVLFDDFILLKETLDEKNKSISDFQQAYVDAIFKIDEMKKLLTECMDQVTTPSLLEDIAKIISD